MQGGLTPGRAGNLVLGSPWYITRKIYLILTKGDIQNVLHLVGQLQTISAAILAHSSLAHAHQLRSKLKPVPTFVSWTKDTFVGTARSG